MNTAIEDVRTRAEQGRAVAYEPIRDGAMLLGRVLLAILFIWSGAGKVGGFDGLVSAIVGMELPLPQVLAAITILIEVGGGIALLLGWNARWAALAIALFLVVITPLFHGFWASPEAQVMAQQINFFKNVAILGGVLMVIGCGPGRYSLDRG
jgi:putative oxidoreductase